MSIEATSTESVAVPSEAVSTPAPDPQAQVPEGEEGPADPWAAHAPPQNKPQSARERIMAREQARQQRAAEVPLVEQLRQEQARVAQLTQAQQHAETEFRRLLDAGDIDGALRVRGIDKSFADIQRQLLIAKGAMPQATDPRVDQIAQQLEYERQQRAQWEQQQQQQLQRQQAQQQWAEDTQAVQQELAGLSAPDAKAFSELPGVAESVLRVMVNNTSLTLEQAAYMVRQDYLQLAKAFSGWQFQPAPSTEQMPAMPQIPNGVPPRRGAVPLKAVPDTSPTFTRNERFKQILKLHGVR